MDEQGDLMAKYAQEGAMAKKKKTTAGKSAKKSPTAGRATKARWGKTKDGKPKKKPGPKS